MSYKRLYNPSSIPSGPAAEGRDEGEVYVYEDKVTLAVNVALATGRPLLVRGPVGSGKSTLARNVACHLGWKFYDKTITSQTRAQDLLWSFDAVRRLADAQLKALDKEPLPALENYIEPGVLWWACDPESAGQRGSKDGSVSKAIDPGVTLPKPSSSNAHSELSPRPVVLLDEIDKADPDEPDNLLDVLGSGTFQVGYIDHRVELSSTPPLIVLTSNDVRQLSAAFRRRCVILDLEQVDATKLVKIAEAHYGPRSDKLYEAIAEKTVEVRRETGERRPGTAEFLDAVKACTELEISTESKDWASLEQVILAKTRPGSELGRGQA